MAQLQITEGSGLSKHMSKKLQMLLPVLKSQPGVEEGTIDLLPGENWAIRTEVTEFYKTTIAGSDLSKVRYCRTVLHSCYSYICRSSPTP